MQTIEDLKEHNEVGILETQAGSMIQRLQTQKNEIEFQLSKKEERLKEKKKKEKKEEKEESEFAIALGRVALPATLRTHT